MSDSTIEPNGDVTQGQDDNGTGNVDDSSSGHPAWQEIYDALPDEALRTVIKPYLEKWDSGVQARFQTLQSEWEPYKDFKDNEVDPDFINQAIGLAAAVEQDPEKVLGALRDAYPDVWQNFVGASGQGVADSGSGDDDEDELEPWQVESRELRSLMEQMASVFLGDQNSREEAEGQAALEDYLEALHEVYDPTGKFDEDFVLNQIANGVDGEKAIENFRNMVKTYGGTTSQGSGSQAPPVLGSGGGSPSNQTTPSYGDADTVSLVKQLLEAANKE
jgi:hypothetical protein